MATDSIPLLRRCSKCTKEKPATPEYFHRFKHNKDGLHVWCKECVKEYGRKYRETHHEKRKQQKSDYYYNNKEHVDSKSRLWRVNNKDRRNETDRKRRAECPAPYRAATRRYKNKHRDRVRVSEKRRYYSSPSPKAVVQRRNARERGLPATLTGEEWGRALDYFQYRCAVCGRPAGLWHVIAADHWIPVSNAKCPGSVATNMIPLCHSRKGSPSGEPSCNNSKGARLPDEWLVERFGKRRGKQILKRIVNYFEWVKLEDSSD